LRDAPSPHYPHDRLGLCNAITLGRLALAAALVAPLVAGVGASWAVFAVAVIALSLDGSTAGSRGGRATSRRSARASTWRSTPSSRWSSRKRGDGKRGRRPWPSCSVCRGMLFAVAAWLLPWMRRDLPERFSRKAVCVVQLGALIALQAPILPAGLAMALVPLAARGACLVLRGRRGVALAATHDPTTVAQLALAALVSAPVLIQPNHPAAMTWGRFSSFRWNCR
jgi:hypothetical protein